MDTPAILANYIGLLLRVVLQSTQVILVCDRMDQFKIEISVHKWQRTRFICNFFHPEGYYDFFKFFGNYYYSCVLWFPACLTKECLVAWTVYRLSSVWIRYIAWHNMAQPAELDICLCMQLCVWLLWIGSRTFSRNFYRENFQWNCNLRFQRSITFCEYILNTVFFLN